MPELLPGLLTHAPLGRKSAIELSRCQAPPTRTQSLDRPPSLSSHTPPEMKAAVAPRNSRQHSKPDRQQIPEVGVVGRGAPLHSQQRSLRADRHAVTFKDVAFSSPKRDRPYEFLHGATYLLLAPAMLLTKEPKLFFKAQHLAVPID